MGYSNSEVAHRFATGIGERCTGSSMFFKKDTIYSYGYHFPMAIKWNGYLLYNDSRYSVTTAKHQGYVLGACSHMNIVHCATLEHFGWWNGELYKGFVEKNFSLWGEEIDGLVKKMAVARKPEKWLGEILRVVGKVERFCAVFELEVPARFYEFDDEDKIAEAREYAREEARRRNETIKRREAEQTQRFNEFKTNWVSLPYEIVRYREDKNRFETSKGVEIPYEVGKRFYESLRDGRLKVGDQVLYYRVSKVGDTIKIGCHTFKRKWLLDYGKNMFNF